jgi:tRNA(Ile)-lysidine synthase
MVGETDMTLLAVSGGVDSVVMAHLFRASSLPMQVAHCNFGLRGDESDADEAFVGSLCRTWQVPFHRTRFDTAGHARAKGISLQMAARELRYEWLKETASATGCTRIATAHHIDDAIETFLLNFTRGCGIRGLHGIQSRNGNIIRPLMWTDRETILRHAESEGITFRTDRSNESIRYTRNLLRHQVVPVLQQVNPSLQQGAIQTFRRIREAEALADHALQEISRAVCQVLDAETLRIDATALRRYPAPLSVLHHLLSPYGFHENQVGRIWESCRRQRGALFLGAGAKLNVHGDHIILTWREFYGGVKFINQIPHEPLVLEAGRTLRFRRHEAGPENFGTDRSICWVDEDRMLFPLVLRHWQPGDRFFPLGMAGKRRKLQDFFSDQKVPREMKARIWILESAGRIVWVVGMRADDRFKIQPDTRRFLEIRLSEYC